MRTGRCARVRKSQLALGLFLCLMLLWPAGLEAASLQRPSALSAQLVAQPLNVDVDTGGPGYVPGDVLVKVRPGYGAEHLMSGAGEFAVVSNCFLLESVTEIAPQTFKLSVRPGAEL